MSMWEQLDNISDYYKPVKRSRTEALRILNRHIKRKRKVRKPRTFDKEK